MSHPHSTSDWFILSDSVQKVVSGLSSYIDVAVMSLLDCLLITLKLRQDDEVDVEHEATLHR